MAITKVAQALLLLSVIAAVIDGFDLRRYARQTTQTADKCEANVTIELCDSCVNPDLECDDECPDGQILSNDRKACIDCLEGCKVCISNETTAAGSTEYKTTCQKCLKGWKFEKINGTSGGTCQRCGVYCDSCEVHDINKCDVDGCSSSLSPTAVVYSNETETCVLCSQNCLECLVEGPGKCDRGKCKEKTAFDPDTKICKDCAKNCEKCTSRGPAKCDSGSCIKGWFDNEAYICQQCDPLCTRCSINKADKCDGQEFCDPKSYFDEGSKTCRLCGPNCKSCTTVAGKCDDDGCEPGFGLIESTCQQFATSQYWTKQLQTDSLDLSPILFTPPT